MGQKSKAKPTYFGLGLGQISTSSQLFPELQTHTHANIYGIESGENNLNGEKLKNWSWRFCRIFPNKSFYRLKCNCIIFNLKNFIRWNQTILQSYLTYNTVNKLKSFQMTILWSYAKLSIFTGSNVIVWYSKDFIKLIIILNIKCKFSKWFY